MVATSSALTSLCSCALNFTSTQKLSHTDARGGVGGWVVNQALP